MTTTQPIVRTAIDGRWDHDPVMKRLTSSWPLLRVWTARDFRSRYRQSALGLVWSFIQPLSLLAIYGTLLVGILHVTSRSYPYVTFAWTGLVPWTFASVSITNGAISTLANGAVVAKVYFPREVIPLAAVGAALMDLAIGSIIMVIIVPVQGIGLSITIIGIVLPLLLLILLCSGLAIFLAALTVFIRDVRHGLPIAMQLIFLGTPIMYDPSLFPSRLRWINQVNPFAVVTQGVRATVIQHRWPDTPLLSVHLCAAAILFVLSLLYTRSVEPRIVDVI